MSFPRHTRLVVVFAAATIVAAPSLAAFSGTDVFLPSVGRAAGISNWYTTVWVHNPGQTQVTAQFFFLVRDQVNTAATPVTKTVAAGATVKYANAMSELFGREGFGAIRVMSNQKLVVNSRIYARATSESDTASKGQFFAGVPASFAIGGGEKAQLLGVYQTQPSSGSPFRYNFGFVETTGQDCTVRVTPRSSSGGVLATGKSYPVRPLEQRQFQFKDEFASLSTDNARLEVEVTGGNGRVIAFGSGIANGSSDPSTFEMSYRDDLLAENNSSGGLTSVAHDATLTGNGTTSSPLALANGAVSKAKLAASGGSAGQVLAFDGSNLVWQDVPGGGLTLPYSGSVNSGDPAISISNSGMGGAIYVTAASYSNAITAHAGSGGVAVYGECDYSMCFGVAGRNLSGDGVSGQSSTGTGVWGSSETGYGVHGSSFTGDGLFAETTGSNKSGVFAVNDNPAGYAAFMRGNASVTGTLTKGGGAFRIDHPLDPENRILQHSFVESPDMMNIYNGNVVTDGRGEAVVELPPYFEALNRDVRYQLTVIGEFAQAIVASEVRDNRFVVRTDKANVKVSWQVTGIRRDAWAEANRIVVEQDKGESERGLYIHPAAFGQPPERDVEVVRHPDLLHRMSSDGAPLRTAVRP